MFIVGSWALPSDTWTKQISSCSFADVPLKTFQRPHRGGGRQFYNRVWGENDSPGGPPRSKLIMTSCWPRAMLLMTWCASGESVLKGGERLRLFHLNNCAFFIFELTGLLRISSKYEKGGGCSVTVLPLSGRLFTLTMKHTAGRDSRAQRHLLNAIHSFRWVVKQLPVQRTHSAVCVLPGLEQR